MMSQQAPGPVSRPAPVPLPRSPSTDIASVASTPITSSPSTPPPRPPPGQGGNENTDALNAQTSQPAIFGGLQDAQADEWSDPGMPYFPPDFAPQVYQPPVQSAVPVTTFTKEDKKHEHKHENKVSPLVPLALLALIFFLR